MSGEQRLEGQGAEELEGRRGLLSFSPTDSVPPSTSALDKAVSVTSAWKPTLFPLVHAPSPNPCSRLGGGAKSQPPGIQHQTHEQQTLALPPQSARAGSPPCFSQVQKSLPQEKWDSRGWVEGGVMEGGRDRNGSSETHEILHEQEL